MAIVCLCPTKDAEGETTTAFYLWMDSEMTLRPDENYEGAHKSIT